jgi:TolA-binding protein
MKYFVIFLLFLSPLLAEISQKDVLLKEANRFSLRRDYEKAISIYLDLLEEYSEDPEIAEKLIENYLLTAQLDKAEKLLAEKKVLFTQEIYTKINITLLLAKSEIKKARKISNEFLAENPGNLNDYKIFASLFERYRQHEHAIEILKKARIVASDEYLYTNELANDYYQINDYSNSIKEYLKHVIKNRAYKNYVQNRIKLILKEDSAQIKTVKEFTESNENDLIKEIFAASLGEIGDVDSALEIYDLLDHEKLYNFADNLNKSGDIENALKAFSRYKEKVDSPELIAEAEIRIAQIYWQRKNYSEAKNILMSIYNSEEIKQKNYRFKTKANRICREMLADLAIVQKQWDQVEPYLQEAKQFSYNQNERMELEYRIIHYQIMNQEYSSASRQLNDLLKEQDSGSDIYKQGFYYHFLLSVFTNNNQSDSLLAEILINLPENEFVNDAIQISLILSELNTDDREIFLEAFRNRQLFNYLKAVELLENIYQSSGNEQILLLAAEWSLQSGNLDKTLNIVNTEFKDEDYSQYALLLAIKIESAEQDSLFKAEEFLSNYPKSVFSPAFRKILTEK